MILNGNPILMALLAAYYALASPVNTQPDQVQAVINSLKAQLKADNINDVPSVFNEAETSLWDNGILNDEIVAKFEQEIQAGKRIRFKLRAGSQAAARKFKHLTLTTEGGVSVDKIAETTIAYLNAKSAVPKPDQEQAASGTVFLDNATMKQVVDHGVKYWGGPCPDGSQAKACCVIL